MAGEPVVEETTVLGGEVDHDGGGAGHDGLARADEGGVGRGAGDEGDDTDGGANLTVVK